MSAKYEPENCSKHVGCAEQVLTEKTMKKLCFSLVCHEKIMKKASKTSLGVRVNTPTRFPGSGTSIMMFLKFLKILFFLKRKFCHRIFHDLTKMLLETKICDYNRKSYWNWLKTWKLQAMIEKFKMQKIPRRNFCAPQGRLLVSNPRLESD